MPSLFSRRAEAPVVQPVPVAEWSPLPMEGVRNLVEVKVLVQQPEVTVTMLQIHADSGIPVHEAEHETEVVCLEGWGYTIVDGQVAVLKAGESVHWPANRPHALWTESVVMVTLMVEHPRPYRT